MKRFAVPAALAMSAFCGVLWLATRYVDDLTMGGWVLLAVLAFALPAAIIVLFAKLPK